MRSVRNAAELVEGTENAERFAERYEDLNEALSADPLLGHAWSEFAETLLLPEEAGERVRNSSRPDHYINGELLTKAGVNLPFFQAFPNFLVGAGLLCTFLGLVAALYFAAKGVASQDIADAQTGLLSNWEQEHERHLAGGGLGTLVRAHGAGLKELRRAPGAELTLAQPVLDEKRLLDADWVLATYESVRDYQHSFGKIPFAAVVFDEVQKIKTPGTQITDAAKALKAEFVLAMTGTPVENRLADLWCIVDTVQPGKLGDLKDFSREYEQSPTPERLGSLKGQLMRCLGPVPPILLRRMKEDRLEGLPDKQENVVPQTMPPIQADAYRQAISEARSSTGRGRMLKALQQLRSISLHPCPPGTMSDDEYIHSSARYAQAFEILDGIAHRGEKALVFLEFLEDQAFLATLMQRRYALKSLPTIISGEVAGAKRQERVNQFQSGGTGFDVMLLSPRAGGVGLTLTAANHVIHLSRWWNPAVEDQCTDRVYRIGQDKPVFVYYPIALFPDAEDHSFDRRLHALLMEKRALSRDMLCPPEASDEDAAKLFQETVFGG